MIPMKMPLRTLLSRFLLAPMPMIRKDNWEYP